MRMRCRPRRIGLMQIMPATWRLCISAIIWAAIPTIPRQYLQAPRFCVSSTIASVRNGFLAAYNAGPSRYLRFLTTWPAVNVETNSTSPSSHGCCPVSRSAAAISTLSVPQDWRSAPLFAASRPAANTPVWSAARPLILPQPFCLRLLHQKAIRCKATRISPPDAAGLFAALIPARLAMICGRSPLSFSGACLGGSGDLRRGHRAKAR